MIAVLAFCLRDQTLTLKNLEWWNELGGCHGHKAMVWRDRRTDRAMSDLIQAEVVKCFDDTMFYTAAAEVDGWPQGANYFFRNACGYLQNKEECRYFLWVEPDAIPTVPGWMDKLEEEYKRGNKPFMGDRVEFENVPLHMSGVGVYLNPIFEKAGEAYRAHDIAWDIAAKDQIVPNAYFTKLIQHEWKHPKFTSLVEMETKLRPECVIFHSSKDGSLIDLLRQKAAPETDAPSVATEPTSGKPSREEIGTRPAQPPGIKVLPNDVWVVEGDLISNMIEAQNRLDVDLLIPKILPYIKEPSTVFDIGAFIGDHTVAYSKAAGLHGMVFAFEPNPTAFACLVHNTKGCMNVQPFNFGLGDVHGQTAPLSRNNGNFSSMSVGDHNKIVDVKLNSVDGLEFPAVNFIKIDVEGYELKVLQGAKRTIKEHQPVMVIEINPVALARQGNTPQQIFGWLAAYGYRHEIIIDYRPQADWYDIIAFPKERERIAIIGKNSPNYGKIDAPVNFLKEYAEQGVEQRKHVLKLLRKAGVYPMKLMKKK